MDLVNGHNINFGRKKGPFVVKYIHVILLFIYSQVYEVLNIDPCNNYISVNDTSMTVAYTASDRNNVTCQTIAPFRWYRYTGTDEGYLTNACPEDFQCGSYSQIWLNDSLPDVNEGETLKSVCIRRKNSCCAAKTTIRAKNCTDFVIYFIIPVPDCANYCYEAPKEDPALSSNKDPICDGDVESFPALVWIIIISLGLLLLLMGLLVFVRGRLKRKNRLQTEEGNEIKNLPPLYDRDPQIKRTRFNRNMLNNTRI